MFVKVGFEPVISGSVPIVLAMPNWWNGADYRQNVKLRLDI